MKQLMNHCGAERITRSGLEMLNDPKPMSLTHHPIRHDLFVERVTTALENAGYEIEHEELSLHQRYNKKTLEKTTDNLFGVMEIKNSDQHGDVGRLVGLRNSSTMHFRAQLGCGSRVFVCDNLSFSANIVVGRKHTEHIMRDLDKLLEGAIDDMNLQFEMSERRVDIYKSVELSTRSVHDIIMKALRAGAIPSSQVFKWLKTYLNPPHEEFREKNCWALQNAFTEVAKSWSFPTMQERTNKLTGVMDKSINLAKRIQAEVGA